jgi:hypothetical protein
MRVWPNFTSSKVIRPAGLLPMVMSKKTRDRSALLTVSFGGVEELSDPDCLTCRI